MRPLAAVPNLEQELDGLFSLPLEEFTKARNDLVGRLKKAHQDDAAAAVKALKKPSVVAWVANQLAREEPQQVTALLEAGAQLRDAQQRVLGGNARSTEVTDAATVERETLRALLTSARALLGERANPSLLDRLGQTLRAAAVSDDARPLLERGRLTEELQAVGFGPLEAVKPARRRGDEVGRAARERVTALRAEARRLSAEASEAEDAADQAAQAAQALAQEATEKRAEAQRAADELADAEEALRTRRE